MKHVDGCDRTYPPTFTLLHAAERRARLAPPPPQASKCRKGRPRGKDRRQFAEL